MDYSIQLYTVRHALEADLPGTIARLAALGVTSVEPYNFVATADALAAAMLENGITAPSGHAPLLSADQHEILAAARRLGITTVIEPHVPAERWTSVSDIAATAAELNAAAATAAGYGIRVGYHNHAWEALVVAGGRTGIEVLADHLVPEVVLELDTFWAAVGGQDPVDLLTRLGDRVRFIHIKDGPVSNDPRRQVAVGSGTLPIWDIIDAATALEVGVIELDDFDGDMFDAVAGSIRFIDAGRATP